MLSTNPFKSGLLDARNTKGLVRHLNHEAKKRNHGHIDRALMSRRSDERRAAGYADPDAPLFI